MILWHNKGIQLKCLSFKHPRIPLRDFSLLLSRLQSNNFFLFVPTLSLELLLASLPCYCFESSLLLSLLVQSRAFLAFFQCWWHLLLILHWLWHSLPMLSTLFLYSNHRLLLNLVWYNLSFTLCLKSILSATGRWFMAQFISALNSSFSFNSFNGLSYSVIPNCTKAFLRVVFLLLHSCNLLRCSMLAAFSGYNAFSPFCHDLYLMTFYYFLLFESWQLLVWMFSESVLLQ